MRTWLGALLGLMITTAGPACAQSMVQSIHPSGVTLSLAQALDWLDPQTFAVGRWDGSISSFRVPHVDGSGPVIVAVAAAPSGRGIEMLAHIDGSTLATSDGPAQMSIWHAGSGGSLVLMASPSYSPTFGTANSGAAMRVGSETLFVSGHEDGHVLIWRWSEGRLVLPKAVDVSSKAPAANPFGIHNVRGLKPWRTNSVVTGSEDGDIVGLSLPEGTELFRVRFNPAAKRGINSISVLGDMLLVSNCAVGAVDRNLWLFDLSSGLPVQLDAENLELDMQRGQVFDFDAALVASAVGQVEFFATTEEGLLWQGRVDHGRLVMSGVTKVASEGAAVLAPSPDGSMIATASGSIRLYRSD